MTLNKNIFDQKINQNLLDQNLSSNELLQISTAIASLSTATVYSVNNDNELPDALENKGRMIFNKEINHYVYSDGENWLTIFTSSVTNENLLYTWGSNCSGQLGNGNIQNLFLPCLINLEANWSKISLGSTTALASKVDGSLWTWGCPGPFNQMGTLSNAASCYPERIVESFSEKDWMDLSIGVSNVFAIKLNRTLWAWGCNSNGILGDGTTVIRASPVSVVGGFSDWCQVSAGECHTAAIRTNGTLWTWGGDGNGRLGYNSSGIHRSSPVSVVGGFSDWCQVSAGASHSAAIRTNGTLWTWGNNFRGQLGNGVNFDSSSPVSVVGGFTDWCSVSANYCHTAAIRTDGTLWTWGCNNCGQLGDGTTISRSSPVSVVGGFSDWCIVKTINCSITAAIRTNGTLWTWGWNSCGQLGDGTVTTQLSPVSVLGDIFDWTSISSGNGRILAKKSDGTLWAWGQNLCGTIGTYPSRTSSPVNIITIVNIWDKISAGGCVNGGIGFDNSLWLWGTNNLRQLGNSNGSCNIVPSEPFGNKTLLWKSFSAGLINNLGITCDGQLWGWGCLFLYGFKNVREKIHCYNDWCKVESSKHSCFAAAIRENGELWTLGNNSTGILGNNQESNTDQFVEVNGNFGSNDWIDVSFSDCHALAIKSDGKIWTWGKNSFGKLGINSDYLTCKSSPVSVLGGFTDWCFVSAGGSHTVALKSDGSLWSWGCNGNGQHGNLKNIDCTSPTREITEFYDWCFVSAGFSHTVALKSNGTLWSWGLNSQGQLGDGTIIERSSPVSVVGGFTDWCTVNSGFIQTAAIRTNGTLWTWGNNDAGQLGDGGILSRSSPVIVVGGFTDWCTVSAGWTHTAAIRTDGTLWTWGCNNCGQLGDDTIINRSSPVSVLGGFTDWCAINAGRTFSIATKIDGTLWSWGENKCGQLGDGTIIDRSSPVSVVGGFTDWCAVSSSRDHTVAIRTNCTLWSWGFNGQGQLGNQSMSNRSSPVSVVGGFTDWCTVSAGDSHAAAIRTNGTLWTWGNNGNLQLGYQIGNFKSPIPIIVPEYFKWKKVVTLQDTSGALKTDGTIWTWGEGSFGKLGNGQTLNRSSPVSISGGYCDWCAISGGRRHFSAIRTNGTLWSWGFSSSGSLGIGCNASQCVPTIVIGGFTNWCDVSVGEQHSIGIQTDGTLWTWGSNGQGQLGDETTICRSSPVSVVGGFSDWCKIGSGGNTGNSFAIRTNGTLWSWGFNGQGRLGDGTLFCRSSPVSVVGGFTDWCYVANGAEATFAIRSDGTLWSWGNCVCGILAFSSFFIQTSPVSIVGGITDWCGVSAVGNNAIAIRQDGSLWSWGNNSIGMLADGTTTNRSSPVSIVGNKKDWTDIGIGLSHMVALRSNGTLWSWGNNDIGKLGLNISCVCQSSPVSVLTSFRDWCMVSSTLSHSVALRKNGTLWAWGCNRYGQLGDKSQNDRTTPVLVANTYVDWCTVSAGNNHTAAIRTNGTLWTWGRNNQGFLGDGTIISRSSPVSILGGFCNWCTVSAGCAHTAAIRTDGTIWSWGCGAAGRLGNDNTIDLTSPVSVVGGFSDWCTVSAGGYHTAAIRTNGTLWAWGNNGQGRLGDGTIINRSSPVSIVGGFTDWCAINAGRTFSIATKIDGTLWTWGVNNWGQLGDGTTICRSSPVSVLGGFTDWCTVIASDLGIGLRSNGTLWTWGINNNGQLGDGTIICRSSPVSVIGGFTDWCAINNNGNDGAIAIRTNGTLWTWGSNFSGVLGNAELNFISPVSVVGGFTDWCQVSAGDTHTAAIRTNGTLWTWGNNFRSQLGNGTPTNNSSSPTIVVGGFTDWCLVSAGNNHTAAIRTNGTLWTWGYSRLGALGTYIDNRTCSPVNVKSEYTDWCYVSSGRDFSGAIRVSSKGF